MTKQDQAWQRLLAHHLETEVPDGSDTWPRLAEQLRMRTLAAADETGQPASPRPPTWWQRSARIWRTVPRLAAGLVAAVLVIVTFLPLGNEDPVPTLEPAAPGRLGLPGGLAVKTAVRHSTVEIYDGTAVQRYEETEWLTADGLYRREQAPLPGTAGSATVLVADGLHVWSESEGTVTVTQNRSGSQSYMPEWVQTAEERWRWHEGRDPCRSTQREGMELVAGRPAYGISVGPDRCKGGGFGDGIQQMIWVDAETLVPLKEVRMDAQTGELRYVRHVHEFAVNVPLDRSLFAYSPPVGTVLRDERADRGPSAYVLKLLLSSHARRAGHRLFVPDNVADLGYVAQWPHFGEAATTLVYVPAADSGPPEWPLQRGLVIAQQDARVKPKSDPVNMIPLLLAHCGGTQLELIVEQTRVTLCSPNLAEATLRAVAESLAPVDGGKTRIVVMDGQTMIVVPDGQSNVRELPVPGIEDAARQADFAVFVPTRVPEGLVPTRASVPTATNPRVTLSYRTVDFFVAVRVTMGPAGSGLDAVPGKQGVDVNVRGGLTGHLLVLSPADGGPILWWIEEGTYVAVSGPGLTEQDLIDIAESMIPVSTATPGD